MADEGRDRLVDVDRERLAVKVVWLICIQWGTAQYHVLSNDQYFA